MKLRLPCAPGLEPLLAEEIKSLKMGTPELHPFAVEMKGGLRSIMRANLELGLASAVWVQLGEFNCSRPSELERKVARLQFKEWLQVGDAVTVKVKVRRSRMTAKEIEARVLAGIRRRLSDGGTEPYTSRAAVEIRVRLENDECQIYLDTSGTPLHRRAYRLQTGKAPLREDLACALLWASGWDRVSPLVDPLMGSGTIPIEAAVLSRRLAPGRLRSFAFQQSPCFDAGVWQKTVDAAAARALPEGATIFGSDRNAGALEIATKNAARAGVQLQLSCAPLSEAPGFDVMRALVTNPPWGGDGDRLETGDVRPLYQRLASVAAERTCAGAVIADPQMGGLLGWTGGFQTRAGGRRVRCFTRAPKS